MDNNLISKTAALICGCFDIMETQGFDMTMARNIVKIALNNIDVVPPSQWIEVKDRYPDTNGYYLVVIRGYTKNPYIDIANFLTDLCDNPQFEYENYPEEPGFYKCDGEGDWVMGDVTHWMSLPELPKKDG